jgi:signal transduction histidine kinase
MVVSLKMPSPVDILLVDDESRNLDALEAILADPSYRLLRAQNAELALRLLLDNDVAAIVLDIKMPGVSGFELARMIKNTKRFRETPIVFLTAYMMDDQDVMAGYGAGAVDYLTKPLNPQILRQKVAVFADLFRKTRQLAAVNAELARVNEKLEERVAERTAELQKSETALRVAAQQKDQFLAVLAHELRNPLAPLRTGVDILLRRYGGHGAGDGTPETRTLSAMNRQLDHMVRLIDDLLDVSRISRGLLELKRERTDLVAIVRTTMESVEPWFDRRKQTLELSAPAELLVYVDQTRVAQILSNLLHNATKFTGAGGSVRVEVEQAGDFAVLRVIDSGAGIRPDQIERVFDMFTRIERPGVAVEPGLGIGLALARRLAEMHGGKLEAASTGEGNGATLSLYMPAAATISAPPEPPYTPKSVPPGSNSQTAAALDVVIVEDNQDIAEVMVMWLEELGHAVSVAHTGKAGIELIRERRPHLVICDLGLPDIPGIEVCRAVRAFESGQRPVIVALTGWGRDEDRRKTEDAGFDQHLVKPVAPDALRALLKSVDEARSSRLEALAGL